MILHCLLMHQIQTWTWETRLYCSLIMSQENQRTERRSVTPKSRRVDVFSTRPWTMPCLFSDKYLLLLTNHIWGINVQIHLLFVFSSTRSPSATFSLLAFVILCHYVTFSCSPSTAMQQIECEWAPNHVQVQPETLPTLSDSHSAC